MKAMQKFLSALFAICLICTPIYAQQGGRKGGKQKVGQIERLMESLELTPKQVEEVKKVSADQKKEMKKIVEKYKGQESGDKEMGKEKRAEIKTIREKYNGKIKAILTPAQYEKYSEMIKNQKMRKGDKKRMKSKDGSCPQQSACSPKNTDCSNCKK